MRTRRTRFLGADDFDFMACNHALDAGGTWDEGEAELRRTHPHWAEHAAAYRANFEHSLVGEVPGTVEHGPRAARGRGAACGG